VSPGLAFLLLAAPAAPAAAPEPTVAVHIAGIQMISPDQVLLLLADEKEEWAVPISVGRDQGIAIVVVTGHGTVNMAIESLKLGTLGFVIKPFTKDELLTNIMVYWVTGTAPSSVRMYFDFSREPLATGRIERPVGMLMSNKDLFPPAPREWGERFFNVERWVETDVGGHFLEWEEPELVARELQTFFRSVTFER